MPLAYDYPLLDAFWTMAIFFLGIIWVWLLIRVFADIYRRHDIGGGAKVLWLILVMALPFLGLFVYLIVNNEGMTQRTLERKS